MPKFKTKGGMVWLGIYRTDRQTDIPLNIDNVPHFFFTLMIFNYCVKINPIKNRDLECRVNLNKNLESLKLIFR